MTKRKKHQITEYEKCLREYHKASPRHVIVLETDLTEDEKRHLFHQADLLRQCGNELLGIMKRHLDQLLRTKKYRDLRKSYGKISKSIKCECNINRSFTCFWCEFCRSCYFFSIVHNWFLCVLVI